MKGGDRMLALLASAVLVQAAAAFAPGCWPGPAGVARRGRTPAASTRPLGVPLLPPLRARGRTSRAATRMTHAAIEVCDEALSRAPQTHAPMHPQCPPAARPDARRTASRSLWRRRARQRRASTRGSTTSSSGWATQSRRPHGSSRVSASSPWPIGGSRRVIATPSPTSCRCALSFYLCDARGAARPLSGGGLISVCPHSHCVCVCVCARARWRAARAGALCLHISAQSGQRRNSHAPCKAWRRRPRCRHPRQGLPRPLRHAH